MRKNTDTARELKKYFRKHKIKYTQVNNIISVHWPNQANFQPLTFSFKNSAIRIWNKLHFDSIHHFEYTTVTKLFEQLLMNKIISPNQLPL